MRDHKNPWHIVGSLHVASLIIFTYVSMYMNEKFNVWIKKQKKFRHRKIQGDPESIFMQMREEKRK